MDARHAEKKDNLVSRSYACVIARITGWGEATVRAVTTPLTLEEALARLAQRHAGEIGRVLRLPAELPEPGLVLKTTDPSAPMHPAWQVKHEVAVRRGCRRRGAARGEDRE
jgi:hypothetical protein